MRMLTNTFYGQFCRPNIYLICVSFAFFGKEDSNLQAGHVLSSHHVTATYARTKRAE